MHMALGSLWSLPAGASPKGCVISQQLALPRAMGTAVLFSLTLKVIPLLWLRRSPCIQPRDGEGLETLVHTRGGDHGTIAEASYPEGFWGF